MSALPPDTAAAVAASSWCQSALFLELENPAPRTPLSVVDAAVNRIEKEVLQQEVVVAGARPMLSTIHLDENVPSCSSFDAVAAAAGAASTAPTRRSSAAATARSNRSDRKR
jgi:hypothetical protein